MTPLLTVEEHRARVLDAVTLLPVETVRLAEAAGRTLAAPVRAAHDLPGFDNSSMDGSQCDSPTSRGRMTRTRCRARRRRSAGGSSDDPSFGAGEAVRIMTGGARAHRRRRDRAVRRHRGRPRRLAGHRRGAAAPAASGAFIRRRGGDTRAGEVVLSAGEHLGPFALAAAAAAGVAELGAPAPRVAVVSTGSELVAPGVAPGRGQTPDSNSTCWRLWFPVPTPTDRHLVATRTTRTRSTPCSIMRPTSTSSSSAGA